MTVSAAFVRRALRHPEGLLCALALDPAALSRNRNFALYATTPLRRVHRRARALRALARSLCLPAADRTVRLERRNGDVLVVLHVTSLSLTRSVLLEPIELSLLKLLVTRDAREPDPSLVAGPQEREEAAAALASVGLSPEAPQGAARCA